MIAGWYPYALLEQHTIGIRGDRIAAIGPAEHFSDPVAARSIDAHGMFAFPRLANLDAEDIEILARSKTHVSYNPVSNFYQGNGIAPILELLRAGAAAASNNSQDMLEALKFGALAQKGRPVILA